MSSPAKQDAKQATAGPSEAADAKLMEQFCKDKHVKFIKSLDDKKDTFEYYVMEHLRMNGVYWCLCALDIMDSLHVMDKEALVKWVLECQHDNGGFGGNLGHDPHILYTLSAVQILAIFGELDRVNPDKIANYIRGLQQEDGSFAGDEWGEIDTRFSYCALCCCALLHRLDVLNVKTAVEFVLSCQNYDGGFGCSPGAESHSGQIFCSLGALAIAGACERVDTDLLGWWLAERQLPCGGFNGRPEKQEDVCYSWWVLSSLCILGRTSWICREELAQFIIRCQDAADGGISDRPNNMADAFHTFFGVAGLSLLAYPTLQRIDPVYALTDRVLQRLSQGGRTLPGYVPHQKPCTQ